MSSCEMPRICEQLQCSICLDVLTDPVTTPCGHNFCDTCLKKCWDVSQDYRCPACKETFVQRPDLKLNVGLKAIVVKENPEGLSTTGELLSDELQCSICLDVFDNPVTTPCGHNFCDTCLKICWDIRRECTCPMCRKTFDKKPDLKFNTGLKAIVELFEKNSGSKREKVMMEYSLPLEREDQEEILVKPSVMVSSTDILTEELQCFVCPDLFNNPPTVNACEHNFFKTWLLEISQDYDCLCCKENSGMLDLKETVQFWLQSEICWFQSSNAKPKFHERVLNIKQDIMMEFSVNKNLNICKKHETILEMFCRGRADKKKEEKHERNSGDCQARVYLFCTKEDHRTHNTLSVDSAEMKEVEEKMAKCLSGPPTGRKGRRKSIDMPPFMASCEMPRICEQLQCSICLDVLTDPVTTPCGHNFCDTCLKKCWDVSQDCRCPDCKETFVQRPDLKFNVGLKAIVVKENPEGLSTTGELLSDELQCSICLDVFDNPVTTPCGHNFCDTCLKICWDIRRECTCPMCRETFDKRPDLKFNTGLKAIVEVFEKNSDYKLKRVMMEYSQPLEEEILVKPSVMASSSDTLTEELQEKKMAKCLPGPPTGRKSRRKSIDMPPFIASCELPHICEQLQCSICLDVTTPCGQNVCDTCLKKCWDISQEFTCPVSCCKEAFNKRPDLKFNTGLKEIVQVFENTSGYEQETVMEYSSPLEREDQEETMYKPLVMASTSNILTKDLQCSFCPDMVNNPPTAKLIQIYFILVHLLWMFLNQVQTTLHHPTVNQLPLGFHHLGATEFTRTVSSFRLAPKSM